MKKTITISLVSLILPGIVNGDVAQRAAEDMCKCGLPPLSDCMDKLAKKYPEVDRSPELQDRVLDIYQQNCLTGIGARGGSKTNITGVPATTGGSADASGNDCSTSSFTVEIPEGWKCRKMGANPQDVTLYAYGNKLNVSLGKNQGKTSCSVIPVCKSEKSELSGRFESTRFTNPMIGSHEYAGHYKNDSTIKLTITSNTKPTSDQLSEIKAILESVKTR